MSIQYGDSRSSFSGFFVFWNTVFAADAEVFESSPMSVKRRRSSGPFWDVERLVDMRERNETVSFAASLDTCFVGSVSPFAKQVPD